VLRNGSGLFSWTSPNSTYFDLMDFNGAEGAQERNMMSGMWMHKLSMVEEFSWYGLHYCERVLGGCIRSKGRWITFRTWRYCKNHF